MPFFKTLKNKSDENLVKLIFLNNEKAFEELLRRYENQLYMFCVIVLKEKSEAEDIVQETFLRFYKSLESIDPEKNIKAFLFRIAKNLCIDFLRKKKPVYTDNLQEISDSSHPLNLICRTLDQKILYNALKKLPDIQKEAIILKYKADMKYSEIARVLNKSESAVESILVRAKKKLKENLKETDFSFVE